jgi:hypothetical protein
VGEQQVRFVTGTESNSWGAQQPQEIAVFFSWLGTTELDCDAPPYRIVKACHKIGFRAPEDVRWCHESNAPTKSIRRQGVFGFLMSAIGRAERRPVCICGCRLPTLETYVFASRSGADYRFLLGQCHQCKTVFWKEE